MGFCSFCGAQLISNARFCPICGRPTDNLYKHYRGRTESSSSNGVYKFVGIAAIAILALLGIAGLSYDGKSNNGEISSFFSVGITVDDIKSIKTVDKMQDAIKNTTWTHTDKGDIWYKFLFKEGTMTHYAAFPSDGHWRYLGEVNYSRKITHNLLGDEVVDGKQEKLIDEATGAIKNSGAVSTDRAAYII